MFKYWFGPPRGIRTEKIKACKECRHYKPAYTHGMFSYSARCVRPTGKTVLNFDEVNGVIKYTPETIDASCSCQRLNEVDDLTGNLLCGKDARYFKSKRLNGIIEYL